MQTISFAEGNEQHLKDCMDALCRSALGEKYFSSPGSAENAILEGIHQGNLYVALIGEECVGFTYIIPKGAFHSFPYLHFIAVKEEYRDMGISFSASDTEDAKAEAMKKAVADAKKKAEVLAEASSLKISGIEVITEGGVYSYQNNIGNVRDAGIVETAEMEEDAATVVQAAKLIVNATVSITFTAE